MKLVDGNPTWMKDEYRLVNPTIEYKESGIIILMWNVIDANDVPETFSFSFTLNQLDDMKRIVNVNPNNIILTKAIEKSVNWIVEDQVKNNPIFKDATMYMKSDMTLEVHGNFINNNKGSIESMKVMLNDYISNLRNGKVIWPVERVF